MAPRAGLEPGICGSVRGQRKELPEGICKQLQALDLQLLSCRIQINAQRTQRGELFVTPVSESILFLR